MEVRAGESWGIFAWPSFNAVESSAGFSMSLFYAGWNWCASLHEIYSDTAYTELFDGGDGVQESEINIYVWHVSASGTAVFAGRGRALSQREEATSIPFNQDGTYYGGVCEVANRGRSQVALQSCAEGLQRHSEVVIYPPFRECERRSSWRASWTMRDVRVEFCGNSGSIASRRWESVWRASREIDSSLRRFIQARVSSEYIWDIEAAFFEWTRHVQGARSHDNSAVRYNVIRTGANGHSEVFREGAEVAEA